LKGYPFALALAFGTLLLLVWLLRTRRLREKYAFLWIALALGICILGAFPRFLFILASLLGVSTPINVLFSSSLVVLFWFPFILVPRFQNSKRRPGRSLKRSHYCS